MAKSPRIQEDQGSRKRSACDGDKFLPTRRCCTILHQQLAAKTEECRQLMNKLAAMEEGTLKFSPARCKCKKTLLRQCINVWSGPFSLETKTQHSIANIAVLQLGEI